MKRSNTLKMKVSALRRKGKNNESWYWHDRACGWYIMEYPENMHENTTMKDVKKYYKSINAVPKDAELVYLEINVINES
jgi:hypothetical protein